MEGDFKWVEEFGSVELTKGTLAWKDEGLKQIGEFQYAKERGRMEV